MTHARIVVATIPVSLSFVLAVVFGAEADAQPSGSAAEGIEVQAPDGTSADQTVKDKAKQDATEAPAADKLKTAPPFPPAPPADRKAVPAERKPGSGGTAGTGQPAVGGRPDATGEPRRPYEPAGAGQPPRDPFSTTPAMREEARSRGPQFSPLAEARNIPNLTLKGLADNGDDDAVALLEVEGHGTFIVRAGDTISLQAQATQTVLRVEKITSSSVMVEVGTLGQQVIVR